LSASQDQVIFGESDVILGGDHVYFGEDDVIFAGFERVRAVLSGAAVAPWR
jgi:hypothetical protein